MMERKRVRSLGAVLAGVTLFCVAPYHLRVPGLIMINSTVSKLFLLPMAVLEHVGIRCDGFSDWAFTFGAHIRGGIWFMNESPVLLIFGVPALLLVIGSLLPVHRRREGAA